MVFGCRKNDFATFSSQDARRPILNFLRKGRADLREKFRFHRTENELSHRGKRGPLRGVSAEMTDLELMQISVPFHMEGSPHGLGCYNQRTTATFFLYFSAVFSGFLSILIPFLTSCDLHPHVFHTCLWHFMWSKAKPRRSNSGGALRYSRQPSFPLDEQHENRAETRSRQDHPMRWDAIIKENSQHGVRSSGKSEAGEKTGVACKERLHIIQ